MLMSTIYKRVKADAYSFNTNMNSRTVVLQRVPEARLGYVNLRVEKQPDDDTYIIYTPHHGTDLVLTVYFNTVYYCIFHHQRRTFEVVGQKVIFSGFSNEKGVVERFNITQQSSITDPEKRRQADEQQPIIWMDVYETLSPPYYRKGGMRTCVDGVGSEETKISEDCVDGRKPVCYTDHSESLVKYSTTDLIKGTRLRVIKFVLKLENDMEIF